MQTIAPPLLLVIALHYFMILSEAEIYTIRYYTSLIAIYALVLRGSHNVKTRLRSYLSRARDKEDTRVSSLPGTIKSNSRIENYARMRILYVHTFAREITRYSYLFLQSVRFSSPTDSDVIAVLFAFAH